MKKEPLAQFLDNLIFKLSSDSVFITDSRNIILGENTSGLIELSESFFPRIEILILGIEDQGYIDQRNIQTIYSLGVMGHIKREQASTKDVDIFDAIAFGTEIRKKLYSYQDDRIQGKPICDGFIMITGFSKTMIEYEIFERITTVGINAEVEIQLPDTYTLN
jgi:hypothetical protein